MRLFKQFLVAIFIIVFAIGLYKIATKNQETALYTFSVQPDSTALFIGTVTKNQSDCPKSVSRAECYLQVSVGQETVYVIYADSGPDKCENGQASNAGSLIAEHAAVKVFGYYQKRDDKNIVLTCPSKNYFIAPI